MRTAVTPVRIYASTRERLDSLIIRLARAGWDRKEVPGLASVIDEALIELEKKLTPTEET
jgi:hypothetical protein